MLLGETLGGSAPPPRQGQRPWTRYRTLQSPKNKQRADGAWNGKRIAPQTASSYPMEKERLSAHGHGGRMPPDGCFASGKTKKRAKEKAHAFSLAIFYVFIVPVENSQRFPSGSSFPMFRAEDSDSIRISFHRIQVSRGGTPLAQGTGAAEAPAWYHQRPDIHKGLSHKAMLSSGTSWAYIRCNASQPTDSNTSRENMHGRQTTTIFPDKLGKAPLSHKPVKHPRAGRRNAADRMRSRRENERLLTERACTISGSSLRFMMPVEIPIPFPQAICGNTIMDTANKLRIPESRG